MKKCCFVVPYFGKLPNTFEVFLKTCECNEDYDWLIFTDDTNKYNLPANVKIIYSTFEEIKNIIQSKFDFEISLDRPYKLCDYKPAYGYIFEDYLKEYRFWGHCDIDTIMGNLNKFITEDILEKYDKLFCLGHMILYKNNYENNRVFMNTYKGKELYKESFSSSRVTFFDETSKYEENVNSIFLKSNKNIYLQDLSLNFKVFPTKFVKTTYNGKTGQFDTENYRKAIYIWNNGNIERYYKANNQIAKEEFMYAHFQQRNMKYNKKIIKENCFKILPNLFTKLEYREIDEVTFKKVKKSRISFHYVEVKLKALKNKIRKILKVRKI